MKTVRKTHPARHQAALWALGALPAAEARRFEPHLAGCDRCRTAADAFRPTVGDLALAAAPVPPSADVRARVIARAAAERPPVSPYQFVLDGDGTWDEVQPGVFKKDLSGASLPGPAVYLIRLAAGARVGTHAHAGTEHCYVIAGDLHVAGRHLRAGDHHVAAAGTTHDGIRSDGGCLALIVAAAA